VRRAKKPRVAAAETPPIVTALRPFLAVGVPAGFEAGREVDDVVDDGSLETDDVLGKEGIKEDVVESEEGLEVDNVLGKEGWEVVVEVNTVVEKDTGTMECGEALCGRPSS
jgi:hypothetical protein